MNNETFDSLKQLLSQPKKIVIVPHQNPDGDAMGSTLALATYLNKFEHLVTVIAPNDYPKFLKWLPESDKVVFFDRDNSKANMLIDEAEIIFILDFNDLHRTGDAMAKALENSKATFVMIDHHQQPEFYTEFMYSDVAMCSTSQMVYHFIERLADLEKIDAAIATCLYVGIMTDTGSFKYKTTTSTTHRVIAELIDRGAQNSTIHNQVYDTNTYQRLQLLGSVLKNLQVLPKYNTAYMYLTEADKQAYDFKKGDSEGFVNYCLSIENIVLAAIFIEDKAQGIIKMSLRSKGNFSVNDFARRHFSGGGHINAAGGRSPSDLKSTIKKFLDVLPQYTKALNK
ncbi:MAG: bifunctional oligoribonuclease/PAP phosphatase NrnA [Flavobacteriaceae bacterium]|nr:bifunctional oligoribonuclease/PAP phosphatase NrnA [Flavobacteriaceae bacterium]